MDVVRAIREQSDSTGSVVLTMHAGDDQIFAAMEAGASAFVGKDTRATEGRERRQARCRGAADLPVRRLSQAVMRRATTPAPPRLSGREAEVLGLLADGLGTAEIAARLYMSESTAKRPTSRTSPQKLGAANRAQALVTAMRLGCSTRRLPPASDHLLRPRHHRRRET